MKDYSEKDKMLCEAMGAWASQFTEEFINETILPNAEKALADPIVRYFLEKWKKAHDYRKSDEFHLAEVIKGTFKNGYDKDYTFKRNILDCSVKYNDILMDIFMRVYGKKEEK